MSPSPPSRQEHVQKVFRKQESVEEMFHRRQASLKKLAAKQTRPVQPVAPRPEAPTKSPCPSPGTSSRPSPWGRPSLRPARCVHKASSALGLLTPFLASVLLPLLWLDGDHLTVGAFPGSSRPSVLGAVAGMVLPSRSVALHPEASWFPQGSASGRHSRTRGLSYGPSYHLLSANTLPQRPARLPLLSTAVAGVGRQC